MAEKKQAPLNTLLTIYFYHTRLTRESYEEWMTTGQKATNGKNINSPDIFYTDFLCWKITEYIP